jgi:hypothetical protein
MAFKPNPPQHRTIQESEDALENSRLSPLHQAQEAAASAQTEAAEAQAFYQFFRRHPELDSCAANEQVLRTFCGEDIFISLELLETALKIMREQEGFPLALRTAEKDEAEREEIIRQLLDLKNGDAEWDKNQRARFNLKNPATRQYVHGLDELRALLEEGQLRQQLAKLSVQDLRKIVKKPEPEPEVLPAKFSAAIIRAMSAGQIRQLLGRYGSISVNNRLQGLN